MKDLNKDPFYQVLVDEELSPDLNSDPMITTFTAEGSREIKYEDLSWLTPAYFRGGEGMELEIRDLNDISLLTVELKEVDIAQKRLKLSSVEGLVPGTKYKIHLPKEGDQ